MVVGSSPTGPTLNRKLLYVVWWLFFSYRACLYGLWGNTSGYLILHNHLQFACFLPLLCTYPCTKGVVPLLAPCSQDHTSRVAYASSLAFVSCSRWLRYSQPKLLCPVSIYCTSIPTTSCKLIQFTRFVVMLALRLVQTLTSRPAS